jgi:aconitase A
MNLANEQEQKYNLTRSQETQKAMESWKKITEAAEIGKLKAEEQYGDYRTMEADCKWMLQVMNSIREFKIAWFVSNKWTTDFISNNRNMKDDA